MKALPLRASCLAIWALLFAAQAAAQAPPVSIPQPGLGSRSPPPPPQSVVHGTVNGGIPGFFPGFYYEREYVPVIEREVIREVPAEQQPAPPPPPRKPYVIGHSYSSLPGGCMKMIQDGAVYYHCSGEWYRQVGPDQYKAVSQP